jgi:NAD(P)-dependent dehydrogenase (short-subunit alcohol dehydrogenase family)
MANGANGCVVVTGAAGALGSVTARRLAKGGASVALLGRAEEAEALRTLATELGRGRAAALDFDATSADAWKAGLSRVEAELGPPVGAALIAGAWQGGTPLHAQADDKVWRAMMGANLETAHASLRALVPGMVARKRGSVVVIGSRAVEQPWTSASASAYAASKSAVVALAKTVAAEVLEEGVRVNAVLFSTLDTHANRRAMPKADASKWVSLDSAAGVIAFLLSDEAKDVSGAALPVYGRA